MYGSVRENNRRGGVQIRRADVCLVAFLILLAAGIFAWFSVNQKEGNTLRISYDGQRIADVPLSKASDRNTEEDTEEEVRYCLLLYSDGSVSYQWYGTKPDLTALVPGKDAYNLLAVSGGRVWMEAADCRDQICVNHRPITGGGENIICLPHKLVVEMTGGTEADVPDGIAKAKNVRNVFPKERGRGYETDG